jgi:8-oxo-dGTP diphosphatase
MARKTTAGRGAMRRGNSTPRKLREGTSAVLLSTDGRLLLQLRDDLPHITDPGKISLFGGCREGDESFLECVVREVHEEISYYLPPERFELIARYSGPHHALPDTDALGEIFLARDVPIGSLTITEGSLAIVALDELEQIRDCLAVPAQYGLGIFLNRQL